MAEQEFASLCLNVKLVPLVSALGNRENPNEDPGMRPVSRRKMTGSENLQ